MERPSEPMTGTNPTGFSPPDKVNAVPQAGLEVHDELVSL
jgi:hypothetical protein